MPEKLSFKNFELVEAENKKFLKVVLGANPTKTELNALTQQLKVILENQEVSLLVDLNSYKALNIIEFMKSLTSIITQISNVFKLHAVAVIYNDTLTASDARVQGNLVGFSGKFHLLSSNEIYREIQMKDLRNKNEPLANALEALLSGTESNILVDYLANQDSTGDQDDSSTN